MLGYELKPEKVKRGPLEAFSLEIGYKGLDLALRVDFATVDRNLVVIDRRAGRQFLGLTDLEKAINMMSFSVPFHFHRTYGHRGVLIFKGKFSPKISDADPYKLGVRVKKIKPLNKNSLSIKTAKLVQEFLEKSFYLLDNHPINKLREKKGFLKANYLLTREAGNCLPRLTNFFKKYGFKNGLVIAENGVVKAGCLLAGFKTLTLPEIEKLKDRYQFIQKAILSNYEKYQLTYIHLKEADEASHDKDFDRKKEYFEFFDGWLGDLLKKLGKEINIIITGDHLTDTRTGKHVYGPLPLLIINHPTPNHPVEFSELEAKQIGKVVSPYKLWNYIFKII
ncbi:MAG: alkaline phosphatase family protein [Patescibacteria group bacterium]|nr:alkaline phosphatase family protein [Patescibacteria group bacterium]